MCTSGFPGCRVKPRQPRWSALRGAGWGWGALAEVELAEIEHPRVRGAFGVCLGCAQGVLRVCSGCVHGVFRVCFGFVQGV